jgi:Helicase associated domain/Helicase conserved C-terminal domain
MQTALREREMRAFREADRSIMSNARCLTEGVDVPAVDVVAFLSPRKSKVDIVQAAGRAMRKADGKDVGYILLPLLLETQENETLDEALERTGFEEAWDVLQAMQEQDAVLAEIIREVREERGRRGGFDDNRLRERVEVIGPEVSLEVLRGAVSTALVDRLGVAWDEMYDRLLAFQKANGHCLVPFNYKTADGYRLGAWINTQRTDRDKLSPERCRRLEVLDGWSWDVPSDKWENGFSRLKEFSEREGHCRVPHSYKTEDGYPLGQWVSWQRYKAPLDPEHRQRLEELDGWTWEVLSEQWEEGFSRLKQFCEQEGHCRVPNSYKTEDGYRLGQWVTVQRTWRKTIDPGRKRRLEELPGWSWNVVSGKWEYGFSRLKEFSEREGHCRVPFNYKSEDGYRLGWWVNAQRTDREKLTSERQRRLGELTGWSWKVLSDKWEYGFSLLKEFCEREGHCWVPLSYKAKDGYSLGRWVHNQRRWKEKLDAERQRRLEQLPDWSWAPRTDQWEYGFSRLKEYSEREGHCRVPDRYTTEDGYRLGTWVGLQRAKRDKMDSERRRRLEQLPGWLWKVGYQWTFYKE